MTRKTRRDGSMTAREMGRKGGRVTRGKYAGTDFFRRIGHLGGRTTSERYGRDFYVALGTKGGAKLRALVAAGRRAEAKAREE